MVYTDFSVRFRDRLLVKQAAATLIIALISGAVTSLWEIANEWQVERATIQAEMTQTFALVADMADKALRDSSQDLANEVVQGIARNPSVATIRLTGPDGRVISQASHAAAPCLLPGLALRLMDDVSRYDQTLRQGGGELGHLSATLDTGRLGQFFFRRVWNMLWIGMLRALLICIPVVMILHHLITRPLLFVIRSIAAIDPAHPTAHLVQAPAGHANDELGQLVTAVDNLQFGFQHGLMNQAIAEQDLLTLARSLEARVTERTADLEQANRAINESITYAARLQAALLPPAAALDGLVAEWCVDWQPLDHVSGDFYWAGRFDRKAVIAVMDCTGHGVPGAFMSALATSALVRVLHHCGHDDPAQILTALNQLVKTTLRQDTPGATSNDGLDAAICVVDTQTKRITFAGAGLPVVTQVDGDQNTIHGDKVSLGYADSPMDFQFRNHVIEYRPGDTFILFTDGITDQVGGPNRRLMGRNRLEAILAELYDQPLDEMRHRLHQRLEQWRGAEPHRDDMTFLAFRPN